MPKAKAAKKQPATKVGGGGVGTRVSKLNLKIVIPIVVLVAALGGFYIFKKSSAGGNYTFVRNASQMWGGEYIKKQNGSSYRIIKGVPGSNFANTSISSSESARSISLCTHFLGGSGTLSMRIYLSDGTVKQGTSMYVNNSSGFLCTWNGSGDKVRQIEVYTNTTKSIQIDTIYGKP